MDLELEKLLVSLEWVQEVDLDQGLLWCEWSCLENGPSWMAPLFPQAGLDKCREACKVQECQSQWVEVADT